MNTSITALELVGNNLDIRSQDPSGRELEEDKLDELESAEVSHDNSGEDNDGDSEQAPARLSDNKAAALCIRAWHITYDHERAKLAQGANDYNAKQEANDAFLAAMPPLGGYRNICDFIACVSQAYIWEIISEKRTARLLAAAKLALSALRAKPKPAPPSQTNSGNTRKNGAEKTRSGKAEKTGAKKTGGKKSGAGKTGAKKSGRKKKNRKF
jgi:hypothetical protein